MYVLTPRTVGASESANKETHPPFRHLGTAGANTPAWALRLSRPHYHAGGNWCQGGTARLCHWSVKMYGVNQGHGPMNVLLT